MEWNLTSDKLHPDGSGKKNQEQILCWVVKKGHRYPELLMWNCYHEIWDDSDGDDSNCSADQVFCWMLVDLPEPPKQ